MMPGNMTPAMKKKKQSQMKSCVQEFGKAIYSWQQIDGETEKLVASLAKNMECLRAAEKCRVAPPVAFQEHPDALPLLIDPPCVIVDCCDYFRSSMMDVAALMNEVALTIMAMIHNEDVSMFEGDFVIFTADHALRVACLQQQYAAETDRKDNLLQRLLKTEEHHGTHWVSDAVLKEMKEQWSHDSVCHINKELVSDFLERNNIRSS